MAVVFAWNSQKYIDLVENGSDKGLQEYQKAEIDYLTNKVNNPKEKTFIDVGAGYGRILPHLASIANSVVAVEIDKDLSNTLIARAKDYANCKVVIGDANELSTLLSSFEISKPVVISIQNCIGPWIGDRYKALDEMRKVAELKNGEVIISLFCREAIVDWGLLMYHSVAGLLGEYDIDRSDLDNGVYKTKSGYESYWFAKEEREEIKKGFGGKLVGEVINHKFHIFHISYE